MQYENVSTLQLSRGCMTSLQNRTRQHLNGTKVEENSLRNERKIVSSEM